jgi:hypothetical protein
MIMLLSTQYILILMVKDDWQPLGMTIMFGFGESSPPVRNAR